MSVRLTSEAFPSDTDSDITQARTQSLVGIAVAIAGNVLISLALNCQKLAHKRLELQKQRQTRNNMQSDGVDEEGDGLSFAEAHEGATPTDEMRLLNSGSDRRDQYTGLSKSHSRRGSRPRLVIPRGAVSPRRRSGLASSPITAERQDGDLQAASIEITGEEWDRDEWAGRGRVATIGDQNDADAKQPNESDYLRSKLWWFGFLLMNVGEFGNFLSYAYAPASVVAPLGTVALIANCFFAPLMLKEKLRKRDLVGVVLAIFGAVTIVGAGKSSDIRLDHTGLIRAITRRPFMIYATVCVVLIGVFGVLSAGPAGKRWVFVDVGLCSLFGGFTVLATKAVSTLLSLHWIDTFKDWITYPVLAVFAITGIGQIKYLNRALMKFDSKVVIPTFFVSFNLSVIVGSAILYGDFEDVEVHQFTTFLYGCMTTFVGVFFLTWSTGAAGVALEEVVVDADAAEDAAEDGDTENVGGPGPTLPPQTQPCGVPMLKTRESSASLVLSAGHYLLVAASPPRAAESSTSLQRSSGGVESPRSLSRSVK